ncbi:glycosyltransferase family A protein [Chryseobacterium sp.]|uniref:glycosyltransferase family 2 protein n=1 Tax=Chryseobacterium sp. TaxID=1871047 RepID=UPI0025BE74B3|nr:glycosyltransferase family A protein [Chryseobacterium sp.]MBV8326774.1 glycosyltransferase family 2 protein [Chryseobacterium sp.]
MKFSILIAHYNNGNYFKECYDSLVHQSYQNWEAIIIDDASTDDSLLQIQDLIKDDPRFRLYINETNMGCGYTKRKCMEFASGGICAFLDPDDALYPHAIESSVHAFGHNKEIVATYSKFMICDKLLNPLKVFKNSKQIYNNNYFFNTHIQISHFFTFKKDAYFKTSGINPALFNAVDQDLYLKILEVGNPLFINDVLYRYRTHPNGISQDKSKKSVKESFSKVILETMHRREIEKIANKKVPLQYQNSQEIYGLLEYQKSFFYRIYIRLKMFLKQKQS